MDREIAAILPIRKTDNNVLLAKRDIFKTRLPVPRYRMLAGKFIPLATNVTEGASLEETAQKALRDNTTYRGRIDVNTEPIAKASPGRGISGVTYFGAHIEDQPIDLRARMGYSQLEWMPAQAWVERLQSKDFMRAVQTELSLYATAYGTGTTPTINTPPAVLSALEHLAETRPNA